MDVRTGLKDHFVIQMKRLLAPPRTRPLGPSLEESVEEARREWMLARRYFETVSEPELVEHAAYLIKATERRYMFLLRLARSRDGREAQAPLPEGKGEQRSVPASSGEA